MSRIDRAGYHAFGDVNEVNYHIMEAWQKGADIDEAIDTFFHERFGEAGADVRRIMENTEDIQRRIFYLNNYYFTEGSRFPRLNHSKNHFWFEIMKEEHYLESGEWFIPKVWERGSIEALLEEKGSAIDDCLAALESLPTLKGRISDSDYAVLEKKFYNLYYVALAWEKLTRVFLNYTKYFELGDEKYEAELEKVLFMLEKVNASAVSALGDDFYVNSLTIDQLGAKCSESPILSFIGEVKKSFRLEKEAYEKLNAEGLYDFVICGAATEGHKIKKEVNFSDTYLKDGICRIPGTNRGKSFSTVNAHGWFAYELKLRPNCENTVIVSAAGEDGEIDFKISALGESFEIREKHNGVTEFEFKFCETEGKDAAYIRIDRISKNTPYIYEIKVK